MTSEVDQRFGRAKFFVVVDTDTGESAAHDNEQNLNAIQGAGIQAARNVATLNVEAIITGNVGPKAFSALKAASISVYIGATGSVKDAVEQLNANKLEAADNANVEGHWM
jgi:predicted Fe-Mo cluster-binding NifX family protein